MPHPSREERLDGVRRRLTEAGPAGAEIVEMTPKKGGLRRRDVAVLVASGAAEWIEEGRLARLKPP